MQITSLAFSPDGRILYSGDEDGIISAWDMDQAKRLHVLSGHSGPVWSLAVSHGSGGLLASGAGQYSAAMQMSLISRPCGLFL